MAWFDSLSAVVLHSLAHRTNTHLAALPGLHAWRTKAQCHMHVAVVRHAQRPQTQWCPHILHIICVSLETHETWYDGTVHMILDARVYDPSWTAKRQ